MSENLAVNDVQTDENTAVNDVEMGVNDAEMSEDVFVDATFIEPAQVKQSEVRRRTSGRITDAFEFNEENVTRGRYEQFADLKDMCLHFFKSYNGKPMEGYIKIVKRPDKAPYETLRIPKTVQEACYTKLKTFMVIEEKQISPRKTLYYIAEVYDRQFIKDGLVKQA